ncbi:trimeric intracellular cation channel family protein [Janibacter cremeus]|uniref:Putative membrane protein YeiH n=1 Tax=Janibacter cremeus TaxID=1285192 RepID=A0A852VTS9_9MICO|nr:trimeric intracellular cation channel family protein [Janibacter cremeus]NYF99409.1 putative membrane protein YeiH [Janibacter cremeus]
MTDSPAVVPDIIRFLDLLGVLANGLLGGAVARRFNLDPVGFTVLAIISALGGGAIRDVLLDLTPIALTDLDYLTVALVAAGVAFLVPLEGRRWRQWFPWVDAIALGTWAVVGTQKALLNDIHWLPAILLGVLTACGGGAVRDMMLGRVPVILQQSELYASAAFVAGAIFVVLDIVIPGTGASLIAAAVGGGICVLARKRGWRLPTEPRWITAHPKD